MRKSKFLLPDGPLPPLPFPPLIFELDKVLYSEAVSIS